MSVQIETLEKNMAKLTIEASAEALEKAIQGAYLKQRGSISVPGFRKGKVPRAMIEKMYGAAIFYEEAANSLIPEAYEKAVEESKLDIVSQPNIDVVQLEKGKDFIFTAEVAVKPEVTLGEYKGITVEVEAVEVTEEDVTAEINQERERNARTVAVEDRAVVDGDTAVIDYEGFVGEVAFEGGKGENHPLVIGSHSFIEGFEEQIIGKNVGDAFDVNVTFPEEYHSEDLSGKEAVFKVVVKEIKAKELPELDDEFAQDVSEFDTFAEYKEDVTKKITTKKENEAKGKKEDAVIEAIIENASMEIPELMIKTQAGRMLEDFGARMQQQGLTMEQYFQFTGTTPESLMEQMKPEAIKRIESRLVLEAIVKAENIETTEEAVNNEVGEMAKMYGMEAEHLIELMGDAERKQIEMDLAIRQAITLVTDAAKEVKAKKAAAKKTAKAKKTDESNEEAVESTEE